MTSFPHEMLILLATTGNEPDYITIPGPLLAWAGGVITLLLGSGGIVAWRKQSADRKAGVASQELAEDQALADGWQKIIEAQTKSLLEPLQKRLGEVEAKVGALESDLAESRKKYWAAISYIRTLLLWFNRHMPDDLEVTALPTPPDVLVGDI